MNKAFSVVPMTDVAALITASNGGRGNVIIRNVGAETVYLGNSSSVTAANGFELRKDESLADDDSTDSWWGICATGKSSSINTIESN